MNYSIANASFGILMIYTCNNNNNNKSLFQTRFGPYTHK